MDWKNITSAHLLETENCKSLDQNISETSQDYVLGKFAEGNSNMTLLSKAATGTCPIYERNQKLIGFVMG